MSYKALYRKYRPDTFEEVVGQEHVVTTLRNEIKADRIAHAYLFTGTRGTGKTSVAKIFAKAVNCENPEDGSPCGVCPVCRGIDSGSNMNVIEIDAASNNGVDNIRQLREEVAYSPTEGKYKVYIIDEVHMLSQSAFNALLKTLEEPPSYVIFILATTDVQRIPVTIISRCQRFDFKRIGLDVITGRLEALLEREQVEADERAIRFIARKAEGGMRDALSLTDQCISFYLGERLTYEHVLGILGAVDIERMDRFFRAVVQGDVAQVFELMDLMIADGKDVSMIVSELTEHVRNVLLLQSADGAEDILDVTEENMELLREDADQVAGAALIRYIRILTETAASMRYAVNKRITLETALIRLCRPQMETDTTSLLERIRRLEQIIQSGQLPAAMQSQSGMGQPAAIAGTSPVPAVTLNAEPEKPYEQAVPEDLQRIRDEWNSISGAISDHAPRFALKDVELQFDPAGRHAGEIYVVAKQIGGERFAHDKAVEQELEQIIEDRLQKKILVHIVTDTEANGSGRQAISRKEAVDAAARKAIHMDLEIEDIGG